MTDTFPPGLNHAALHATTGDMPLTAQPTTIQTLSLSGLATVDLINAGTSAAPIALTGAGLFGTEIYLSSSATSGTLTGAKYDVAAANASGNLSLIGLHGMARVTAGIDTGTGSIRGAYIQTQVLSTGVVGGRMDGVQINMYAPTGSSMGSDVCGLYINNFIQVQPTGAYELLRLEANGGMNLDEVIGIYVGGGGDALYWMALQPNANTGWSYTGTKTGAEAGWLKLWVGGNTRYIQLWTP